MDQNRDDKTDAIIRELQSLEGARGNWNNHWETVAERVWPVMRGFQSQHAPGQRLQEKVFDGTAMLGLSRFAAAIESLVTPRTQRWHKLRASDPRLVDDHAINTYLDQVTEILFSVRYGAHSTFAGQSHELYMSLGAFGTGCLFVDDGLAHFRPGMGNSPIIYKSIHLCEIYIKENAWGVIDTVYRKFKYTARQAIQQFGEDNLPDKIKECGKSKPDTPFEFVHCVKPNDKMQAGRRDYRGMPLYSCYVALDSRQIVSEGGYTSMPYMVPRYETSPNETYGRSPAMMVLPDILMVNEMSKTTIRAGQRVVDPPLLLQEDGALQAFSMRPGALNYGGVDDQGRAVVHPLQTGANLPLGLDMMQDRRQFINDAFLVTLFQIMVDSPTMTATEAMLRAQEKGALLAPTAGRLQSEYLGMLISREIDILSKAGMLPEMPQQLVAIGGEYTVEFDSPITRAQRAEEGVGILRTLEAAGSLAQFDPEAIKVINGSEALRELAEINGVPSKILRSREEVDAADAAAAQQQQLAQVLQAAPVIADTAQTLANTEQISRAAGQPTPGIGV